MYIDSVLCVHVYSMCAVRVCCVCSVCIYVFAYLLHTEERHVSLQTFYFAPLCVMVVGDCS